MGISPRYNKQEHNRRKKLRDRGADWRRCGNPELWIRVNGHSIGGGPPGWSPEWQNVITRIAMQLPLL